jgi:hypothetical protein
MLLLSVLHLQDLLYDEMVYHEIVQQVDRKYNKVHVFHFGVAFRLLMLSFRLGASGLVSGPVRPP